MTKWERQLRNREALDEWVGEVLDGNIFPGVIFRLIFKKSEKESQDSPTLVFGKDLRRAFIIGGVIVGSAICLAIFA